MPPTQLFHPSPKRKRDQTPHIPLLNTALRPASTPPRHSPAPASGVESPENEVADRLRYMSLSAPSAIPMSPLTPSDDVVRKKPKLEAMKEAGAPLGSDFEDATLKKAWYNRDIANTITIRVPESIIHGDIPETPQPQPQPRTLADITSFAQPTQFISSQQSPSNPGYTFKSRNRSSQPRQRKRSPSPSPLSALTWQDGEITGHLADPKTDPDDDGTGLNGIGFRPTPAIAYARSQRRRQQVSEWKAREAREARAKRSERRRRGVGGAASREATVERDLPPNKDLEAASSTARRTVKFAI